MHGLCPGRSEGTLLYSLVICFAGCNKNDQLQKESEKDEELIGDIPRKWTVLACFQSTECILLLCLCVSLTLKAAREFVTSSS